MAAALGVRQILDWNYRMKERIFYVFLLTIFCMSCSAVKENNQEQYYPEIIEVSLKNGSEVGLGKYPITIKQFSYFVSQSNYLTEAEKNVTEGCWGVREDKSVGWMPNENWNNNRMTQGEQHPVVCVSWNDALAYTKWLSSVTGEVYRLPYAGEWEYAAHGDVDSKYYFGDNESEVCKHINHADINFLDVFNDQAIISKCDDGFSETSPVGTYSPNLNALFDMYGNVWEWQLDCVGEEQVNSDTCTEHALRGASYASNPSGIVIGYKNSGMKNTRTADYGFRVLKEIH